MKLMFSLAFVCIVIAILRIFKLDTSAVADAISTVQNRKQSLKKQATTKKPNKLIDFAKNIVTALDTMGQIGSLYMLILLSFLLIVVGSFAGITFGNVWLSITFGIMLALIPFIYVRMQYIEYKSLLLDEMETGLSVITSSIERLDNIHSAFLENIRYINKPLRTVFEQFLYALDHSIPFDTAADRMKSKVNHSVFTDWCDTLKLVSRDRNMKTSLRPIVNRITDIKVATGEARNILKESNSEFVGVMMISLIFMAASYLGAPAALAAIGFPLKSTDFMGTLLAFDLLMLFICWLRAFLLTKDIDFESI